MNPTDLAELQAAIKRLHGCGSRYVESVPVNETFKGKPVWQGVVEVFDLEGHATAKRAFAWKHQSGPDDKGSRFVAVLSVAPVDTPQAAVKAALVAEYREKKK